MPVYETERSIQAIPAIYIRFAVRSLSDCSSEAFGLQSGHIRTDRLIIE